MNNATRLQRSVSGAVAVLFSIAYTHKKYIYFRYFSIPSLDSLQIVCYKPSTHLTECEGVAYEGDLRRMLVFHLPQSLVLDPNNS